MAATRPPSPSTPIGMSYRAATVPMMLTVVGVVLTAMRVTVTVGISCFFALLSLMPSAWVRRKASPAAMSTAHKISNHIPRRAVSHELGAGSNSLAMTTSVGDAIDQQVAGSILTHIIGKFAV